MDAVVPLSMEVDGTRGVWLPLPLARRLVPLLELHGRQVAAVNGARPVWVQVVAAAIEVMASPTAARSAESGSAAVGVAGGGALSGHDVIGAREAAELLGCQERNVRDLAARGSLPALSRAPWTFDRDVVTAYASRRRAG